MKNLVCALFTLLSLSVSAQMDINVSGTFTLPSGEPAQDVQIFIATLNADDESELLYSDSDGAFSYSFAVADSTEGCFEIIYFDCDGHSIFETYCYDASNFDFEVNYEYCPFDNALCDGFILDSPVADSSQTLFIINAGIGPYSYAWSTGDTTETTSVPQGVSETYCVTVTHGSGCEVETCFTLGDDNEDPDPDEDFCEFEIFELEFEGGIFLLADAFIALPISSQWSSGETESYIYPLESGEYCVTITYDTGCISEACYTVDVGDNQSECFSFIYELENNANNGILQVETFGVGPFEYQWSLLDSDEVVGASPNLVVTEEATYCVTITDSEGCTNESCFDYESFSPCEVYINQSPGIGQATLFAYSTSTGHLSYEWSNGDTMRFITVTDTEEYCVTITDEFGCVDTGCTIPAINALPSCYTVLDVEYQESQAVITTTHAGEGDFSYLWSNGATTSTITVSQGDIYCVEVVDNNTGCFFSVCASVDPQFLTGCYGKISITSSDNEQATLDASLFSFGEELSGDIDYEWNTGEDTEIITVDQDGTYCVTITQGADCITEACIDLHINGGTFAAGTWVYFYDEEIQEGLSATVELYTMNEDSTMNLVAEATPSDEFGIEGIYFVDTIIQDIFLVLAKPDLSDIYAPTYGESAATWEDATWYDGTEVFDGFFGVQIEALKIETLEGLGSINGTAFASALQSGDDIIEDAPLSQANIMLTHTDIIVGQMYSHDDGSFEFTDLPYGTYEVMLEQIGKPTISIEVTLTEDDENVEITFGNNITSTNDRIDFEEVNVYPNPSTNFYNVEVPENAEIETSSFIITDINGKQVRPLVEQSPSGFRIDLSNYQNGIYLLQISDSNTLYQQKLMKM